MVVTLDAKRRLRVPKCAAPVEPGDSFTVEFDPHEDAIVFRRLSRGADWLEILSACPVPMDDFPMGRRERVQARRPESSS